MKIEYQKQYEKIREYVIKHAKYQKVMLIFDDYAPNVMLDGIYETIKSECIFNKMSINSIDFQELNNGYKLLIIFSTGESFLHAKINTSDFDVLFCALNKSILPFFCNYDKTNSYIFETGQNCDNHVLILNKPVVDICVYSSLYFNKFYQYLKDILTIQTSEVIFNFQSNVEINLDVFKDIKDMEFVDLKLIENAKIEYKFLPIVHLILIDAFMVLFEAVKKRRIELVDVYKSAKDDIQKIDKFYAKITNDCFLEIINLNYNYLMRILENTKREILELIDINFNFEDVNKIILSIKEYLKNDDSFLSYLYIYNIFST